jgi:uncharacterized repeat protein (TIGR01451 family)
LVQVPYQGQQLVAVEHELASSIEKVGTIIISNSALSVGRSHYNRAMIDVLTPTPANHLHPLVRRISTICGAILGVGGILAIVPQSALAQVCGTPGKDGTVSASGVINTYHPGTGTASTGSTTVGIGAMQSGGVTAIAAGDLVLIMQMQDGSATTFTNTASYGGGMSSSVGSYEYARVASVSGSTLTLAKALTNTYSQVTPTTSIAKKSFQVIRVPQYVAASLSAGITALPWDGSSGGIVAFDVYNTLDFSGQSIDVTGKGFRGGGSQDVAYWYQGSPVPIDRTVPFIFAGTYSGTNDFYPNKRLASFKGEGIAGTPYLVYDGTTLKTNGTSDGYPLGDLGRGAPGNAGGGGIVGGELGGGKIPGHDAGGGGGGNIGAGGIGGDTWEPPAGRWPNGGLGGNGITPSFTKILMGGGGGAGITTNATFRVGHTIADGIVNGGPGGGIVFVRAGAIGTGGSILAQGIAGTNGYSGVGNDTDAGGGGGAGGSVVIAAKAGSFNSLIVNVSGGNGANSTYKQHGPGGGGGGGLVAYGGGATGMPVDTRTGGAAGFDISIGGSTISNYGSAAGAAGEISTGLPHTGCSRSKVLIVKRITAINGVSITSVVHNSASAITLANDSDPNWPTDYLKGAIDGGNVKPNDEVEYTIYYLNSGNVAAKKLRICDRLHKNLIFQTQFDITNSTTIDKGINLTPGNNITQYLTNASNDDSGFLSTTSTLPSSCNLVGNTIDPANLSDNVVVVDLADNSNYLPGSISPGNPTNSFGYIRFKTKIRP